MVMMMETMVMMVMVTHLSVERDILGKEQL